MKTPLTDLMIANAIDYYTFACYENKYIAFTFRDLLSKKTNKNIYNKTTIPVSFNVFTFDPDKKTIQLVKNFDNEVLKYINTITEAETHSIIEDRYVCSPLTAETRYIPKQNRVVADIMYRFYNSKKETKTERYFFWYDINTQKSTVIKRDKKYCEYFFVGVKGNICYF